MNTASAHEMSLVVGQDDEEISNSWLHFPFAQSDNSMVVFLQLQLHGVCVKVGYRVIGY